MSPSGGHTAGINVAAYLRCYPSDLWQMANHRHAMADYAKQRGLPLPAVHMDNGCPSKGRLPELERLIQAAEAGIYQVLLIPGPWVFSLCSARARAIMQRLAACGCRVLELPRSDSGTPSGEAKADTATALAGC